MKNLDSTNFKFKNSITDTLRSGEIKYETVRKK